MKNISECLSGRLIQIGELRGLTSDRPRTRRDIMSRPLGGSSIPTRSCNVIIYLTTLLIRTNSTLRFMTKLPMALEGLLGEAIPPKIVSAACAFVIYLIFYLNSPERPVINAINEAPNAQCPFPARCVSCTVVFARP